MHVRPRRAVASVLDTSQPSLLLLPLTDGAGDGCPATEATLYQPSGVAVDSASNGYSAATYLNLVRNVAPNGISSVVASVIQGTYIYPGYNGDNSPATSAAQASTT